MSREKYFRECIEISFSENGITATPEQIAKVADDVTVWVENMSLAFHMPENPMIRELDETKRKLEIEKSKVFCKVCKGQGYITENYYNRSSTSQCWKCNGDGKITL